MITAFRAVMSDEQAQEVIRNTIAASFPTHEFLGEEDVAPGATAAHDAVLRREAAERLWIVDPIDGTVIAHSHRIIIIN